jgi:3-carboxy-cis,cis-muconate cycloisomerase
MSPSSSPSDPEPFGFLVAAGPIAATTSATAWLQAMLDAEAALAGAWADVGAVPRDAAERIAGACRLDRFDVDMILAQAELGGNAVIPLVPMLREAVGEDDAAHVHRGATSQDIVDAAAALVVARSGIVARAGLRAARASVGELATRFGATAMIARTLGQHAVPTTFSTITDRWADGLEQADRALSPPSVGLGGPAGDGSSYGQHLDALVGRFSARLELPYRIASRHAQRSEVVAIAGAWAQVATAVAKIALDIVVLAQSDAGELLEDAAGAGRSSSMSHKHNPIAAVSARAAAMQAPGLVATLLQAAGSHELERAAGAWHAEWPALQSLLRSTGSAVEWLRRSLDRLVVDPERMAVNLRRGLERR